MRTKRILIVDDESGFTRLLKLGLERKDRYKVLQQSDPTQALEAAVKFKPDLVLLDFVMPKLHGGDVAARIRADSRFHHTPILFLSGTVMKRTGETPQIAGFEALAKPIGLNDLIAAIERNLAAAEEAAPRKSRLKAAIGKILQPWRGNSGKGETSGSGK